MQPKQFSHLTFTFVLALGLTLTFLWTLNGAPVTYAAALLRPHATEHTVGGACGATIQACINAAAPGDTVQIPAGDYTESLTLDKAVSLTGVSSATTVIHAVSGQRVMFVTGATIDNDVTIANLTLMGGDLTLMSGECPERCGAGIMITGTASPKLENLMIAENKVWGRGGGLFAAAGSPMLLNGIHFSNNYAWQGGGGAYIEDSLVIDESKFGGNSIYSGTGAALRVGQSLTMTNTNIFDSNVENHTAHSAVYVAEDAIIYGGQFMGNSDRGLYVNGSARINRTEFISNDSGPSALINGVGAYISKNAIITDARFLYNKTRRSGFGSGLFVAGSLKMHRTLFKGNHFVEFNQDGGGLAVTGEATIIDSDFISNTAISGGAIYTSSPITITNSTFISNTAFSGGGGAVFAAKGLTIMDSRFVANSSRFGEGGAINRLTYIDNGISYPFVVHNSDFIGNDGRNGGAIFAPGSLTVTNSLFENNHAQREGGGLRAAYGAFIDTDFLGNISEEGNGGGGAYIGRVTIVGGRFERNVARDNTFGNGGGLVALDMTLRGTTFISNTTGAAGGGLYMYGKATLQDVTFIGNRSGDVGGGLYVRDTATITNAEFTNNYAVGNGGGAKFATTQGAQSPGGHVSITNARFIGNVSEGDGGGLYTPYTLSFTEGEFVGNQAQGEGGGIGTPRKATIVNVRFEDNIALGGSGGAIASYGEYASDQTYIDTSQFINNRAAESGGGVRMPGGSIFDSRFEGNRAEDDGGGLLASSSTTISNTQFIGNETAGEGGGAYMSFGGNVYQSRFVGNRATNGAALATFGCNSTHCSSRLRVENTLLARNQVNGTGSMLWVPGGSLDLTYVTIADANLNPHAAVAFRPTCYNVSGCTAMTVNNSIIANHAVGLDLRSGPDSSEDANFRPRLGYNLYLDVSNPISATDITPGANSFKGDPAFVDPANDDYHLGAGSQAIDKADTAACPALDLEGTVRPTGLGCDIGAYEAAPVVPVIELGPREFHFIAMGGVNPLKPEPQPLTIGNSGAGTLQWAASGSAHWLSASPASGSGAGSTNVTIDQNGLTVGTHEGTLTVSGNALRPEETAMVHLEVLSGCQPLLANGDFEAGNSGWAESNNQSGALIVPNSEIAAHTTPRAGTQAVILGTADGQQSDLSQSVKLPSGVPLTLYYAYFINSNEASCVNQDKVEVRLDDAVVAEHTLCTANNTAVWQGHTVDLSGYANRSYTLHFHQKNDPLGTPSTFLLDDVAIPFAMSVTCSGPALQVTPPTLTFATDNASTPPASQSFTVNNGGTGELTWRASASVDWLSLSATSGAAPATVVVSVSPFNLSPGVHSGQITISSEGSDPQVVTVALIVGAGDTPTLAVTPPNLTIHMPDGSTNANLTLDVRNLGSGALTWSATESIPWLTLDASSGTTPVILQATVDTNGMARGSYSGQIVVTSSGAAGSPQIVNVSLVVGDGEGGGNVIYLPLITK